MADDWDVEAMLEAPYKKEEENTEKYNGSNHSNSADKENRRNSSSSKKKRSRSRSRGRDGKRSRSRERRSRSKDKRSRSRDRRRSRSRGRRSKSRDRRRRSYSRDRKDRRRSRSRSRDRRVHSRDHRSRSRSPRRDRRRHRTRSRSPRRHSAPRHSPLGSRTQVFDSLRNKFPYTDETRRNLPMLEYRHGGNSTKSVLTTLLEVYSKYKSELFNPAINEHDVWNKIASEMHDKCNLNHDELQYRNKIEELRNEYERAKNIITTAEDILEFLNAGEKAFGTSKHLGSRSSPKYNSRQKRKRRLEVLRAYNMFKEELSLPDVHKEKVWGKMTEAVRNKYSLSKGSYGLDHFHSEMLSMKSEYERKRNLKSHETTPDEAIFLKEAQLAFQDDSEFQVIPVKKISGSKCSRRFREKLERHFAALKFYNLYKKELSLPDKKKINVWKKIVETVRMKCSLSKGRYGLSQFRYQILSFKCEYEKKRNLDSNVITPHDDMFLKEAQIAFEDPDFPDHLEQINHLATGINPERD